MTPPILITRLPRSSPAFLPSAIPVIDTSTVTISAVIAIACLAGWLGGRELRAGWRLSALLGMSGGLAATVLSETRSAWASLPVMATLALLGISKELKLDKEK